MRTTSLDVADAEEDHRRLASAVGALVAAMLIGASWGVDAPDDADDWRGNSGRLSPPPEGAAP